MEMPLGRRVRRLKIDEYLGSLHCVIWPETHWDLTDPKERAQAVEFLERALDAVG